MYTLLPTLMCTLQFSEMTGGPAPSFSYDIGILPWSFLTRVSQSNPWNSKFPPKLAMGNSTMLSDSKSSVNYEID